MLTFAAYLTEEHSSLVKDFHSTLSDKEKAMYKKRDNCGMAASHLCDYAKTKNIPLQRVKGHFKADTAVSSQKDFTSEEKAEFHKTGLDFTKQEHRQHFIKNHPRHEEWKKIPHYWTKDHKGNIHDPSGHEQFVKRGLASDLNPKRYVEG